MQRRSERTTAFRADADARPASSRRPPRGTRPPRLGHTAWLIAGRIAVALVAVLVLDRHRAGNGRSSPAPTPASCRGSISAIVTDDTNISTATVRRPGAPAPTRRRTSCCSVRTPGPERNGNAGNTDASTSDGVANSDTQMIAHISGDRQHVTVLSIPRDTMIDGPDLQHLGRRHRPALRQDLPGQQRRSLAHQLRLLGRRPEVLGPGHPGPHRPEDRPGDRHRLLRVQEHGRRAGWGHGERLRADHRQGAAAPSSPRAACRPSAATRR